MSSDAEKNLWEVRFSGLRYPAISAAEEIGLFQSLRSPMQIAGLATESGCSELAVEVLIRVLWADGLVAKGPRGFELTDVSKKYFLKDSRYYWGPIFSTSRENAEHAKVISAVKQDGARSGRGEKSFAEMWTSGEIENGRARIETGAAEVFTQRMHVYMFAPAVAAASSGAFDGVRHLLDAGGGAGTFGIALSEPYPDIKITLLDFEPVCEVASRVVENCGKAGNFEFRSGNIFDALPTGHDAVLFSNIFHNWGRHDCDRLAKRASASLESGGKIFVHEMVLDEDRRPSVGAACYGLLMFLNFSGKQYTKQELKQILSAVGFDDFRITTTCGDYSVVSATKA